MTLHDSEQYSASVAVVGAGYWGKNLVRNHHTLGSLHTICDAHPENLSTIMQQYPNVRGVSSFATVLNDPEIKAVVLATPATTHFELVREVLLAGKDVFVEKPLALTLAEGAELNYIAQERQRILMVGHLLWYHPVVLKLKELVDSGALGRIQYIYSNRLNLGKLRRDENILWSFAPHDISLILGLVGEIPNTVQAQGGNYLHQRIADTTVTLLNFTSGVRAHIFVSWLHPFKEQRLVVVGEKQMAVFNDLAPWSEKLLLFPHTVEWQANQPIAIKEESVRVDVPQDEPLRAECRHFLECVATRKTPRTDGVEGLRSLEVLSACQTALEQNSSVQIGTKPHDEKDYFAHASAIIAQNAKIGSATRIWHFSHILPGSQVGRGCSIGQNVVIGPNVSIGDQCKIQNNVSVYEGVTLEAGVFCGPSMVFTNVFNPRSHISRKHEFRSTLVQTGSTIGANVTVICGVTLGRYSFIGAGSVVTKDVMDYALVVGNPARRIGWMCQCGNKLPDDLTCQTCGSRYQENIGKGLVEVTCPSS